MAQSDEDSPEELLEETDSSSSDDELTEEELAEIDRFDQVRSDKSKLVTDGMPRSFGFGGGLFLVFFGLPFLGVGVFITLLGLGIVDPDRAKDDVPPWVVMSAGSIFGLAGLGLMFNGVLSHLKKTRYEKLKAQRPSERWFWDYSWNQRGTQHSIFRSVILGFIGLIFFGAFLAPFNFFIFLSPSTDATAKVFGGFIIGLFDLIFVALVVGLFRRLLQGLRYGSPRLAFMQFPFMLGSSLDVRLEASGLDKIQAFKAKLRCLFEETVVTGSGKNSSRTTYRYLLWQEERQIPRSGPISSGINISFRLPSDEQLGTSIVEQPTIYWELVVSGAAPGVDFEEFFLVPVYSRNVSNFSSARR